MHTQWLLFLARNAIKHSMQIFINFYVAYATFFCFLCGTIKKLEKKSAFKLAADRVVHVVTGLINVAYKKLRTNT